MNRKKLETDKQENIHLTDIHRFINRGIFKLFLDKITDWKLGIDTTGYGKIASNKMGDQTVYDATSYNKISKVFNLLNLNKDDLLIDIGCGKGRVICMAGLRGIKSIGIEHDKNLAGIAESNIRKLKLENVAKVVNCDAVDYKNYKEGTVFFLFNPFGRKTLEKIAGKLKGKVAYANPVYGDIFNERKETAFFKNIKIWDYRK